MAFEACEKHPQNPYQSFLVQASAGSGKTYQLSKRYLHLVASGASPSSILTITFTVRAAAEMRSRIISEAGELLVNLEAQKAFDQQMNVFYQHARSSSAFQGKRLPPPLSGAQAATRILANTQMLKITTIDSLFREWTARFPFEASADQTSPYSCELNPSASIGDSIAIRNLEDQSWQALFNSREAASDLSCLWEVLAKYGWEWSPLQLRSLLQELFRLQTFIWFSGNKNRKGALLSHVNAYAMAKTEVPEAGAMIYALRESLLKIAGKSRQQDQFGAAIYAGDLQALIQGRLLTRDLKIHGGTIRGKKREGLASAISHVEESLRQWSNFKKIQALNETGAAFFRVYEAWISEREKVKKQSGLSEFSDLTIGSYQLFHQDKGLGAIWQIQQNIRHMMFDEFQDTSLIQWGVFEKLTRELLSGEGASSPGGLSATVFIVGDYKQSVYGFREADPAVMNIARDCLAEYDKLSLPLNMSYRSSPLILDFVNRLFAGLMLDFPIHRAAKNHDNSYFIPDRSRVCVFEWAEKDTKYTAAECEAARVATHLKTILFAREGAYQVFDRKNGRFRRPQYSDCCILYRSSTNAHEFEKALRQEGLPYLREEKKGFFERPEISDMLCLFRFLLDPADTPAILTLVQSPVLSPGPDELSEVLSGLLDLHDEAEEREPGLREKLRKIWLKKSGTDPERLRDEARTMLPHQILSRVYMELDIPSRYENRFGGSEGLIARRNLIRLIEVCSTLEDEGYVTLPGLLQRLTDLSEPDEWSSASGDQNVIRLMTIHKAKGLEFPVIIVVEAGDVWCRGDRYWLPDRSKAPGVYFIGTKSRYPDEDPSFNSLLKRQNSSLYEETLRLLYVALTRASQYLVISGHRTFRRVQGSFLEKALDTIHKMNASRNEQEDYWEVFTTGPELSDNKGCQTEGKGQGKLISGRAWFVAAADRCYAVPVETAIVQPHAGFSVVEGPESQIHRESAKAESRIVARVMGTYIHKCLELSVKGLSYDAGREWSVLTASEVLLSRDPYWKKHSSAIYRHCLAEVRNILDSEIWAGLFKGCLSSEAEKAIVSLQGSLMVRGQVDLVIRFLDSILLVDYKTGALPFSCGQLKCPQERTALLTDYCYRQGYRYQMGLYSDSFARMFPSQEVRAGILFTKGPWFIPVNNCREADSVLNNYT